MKKWDINVTIWYVLGFSDTKTPADSDQDLFDESIFLSFLV